MNYSSSEIEKFGGLIQGKMFGHVREVNNLISRGMKFRKSSTARSFIKVLVTHLASFGVFIDSEKSLVTAKLIFVTIKRLAGNERVNEGMSRNQPK